MKTAGTILRAGFRTDYSPSFPSHSGNGEVAAEREISGNVGVQFVYFNKDYSTKYFIGFLDSRERKFSKLRYSALGVNIFKTFPFLPVYDTEATGMAVLCQKPSLLKKML